MKTRDLLKLPDTQMAHAISAMKGQECEKHARNYCKILGIDFKKAVMEATAASMFGGNDEPVKLRTYKAMVDFVTSKTEYGEREATILTVLLLAHISKRAEKVPEILKKMMSNPA